MALKLTLLKNWTGTALAILALYLSEIYFTQKTKKIIHLYDCSYVPLLEYKKLEKCRGFWIWHSKNRGFFSFFIKKKTK